MNNFLRYFVLIMFLFDKNTCVLYFGVKICIIKWFSLHQLSFLFCIYSVFYNLQYNYVSLFILYRICALIINLTFIDLFPSLYLYHNKHRLKIIVRGDILMQIKFFIYILHVNKEVHHILLSIVEAIAKILIDL